MRIVSIIPGMDTAAPERTETSSGSLGSPKRLPDLRSSASTWRSDLVREPVGQNAAGVHVVAAGLGRDREPGGHGHAELRHLGETDPLAPQQLTPSLGGLVEVVDVCHSSAILCR